MRETWNNIPRGKRTAALIVCTLLALFVAYPGRWSKSLSGLFVLDARGDHWYATTEIFTRSAWTGRIYENDTVIWRRVDGDPGNGPPLPPFRLSPMKPAAALSPRAAAFFARVSAEAGQGRVYATGYRFLPWGLAAWLLVPALGWALAMGCFLVYHRLTWRPPASCTGCGYSRAGLPPRTRCPECGRVRFAPKA